jgi:hypothetical protein
MENAPLQRKANLGRMYFQGLPDPTPVMLQARSCVCSLSLATADAGLHHFSQSK